MRDFVREYEACDAFIGGDAQANDFLAAGTVGTSDLKVLTAGIQIYGNN